MIEVVCGSCSRKMQARLEYLGKRVKCKCGHVFLLDRPTLEPEAIESPTVVEEAPLPILIEEEHSARGMGGDRVKLKLDWKNWNLGEKVIFVSTCAALVSMLMPWVDVGIASANGVSQGAVLFLIVFIYPVWMLLSKRSIRLWGGVACGSLGILSAIAYIASKQVNLFGHSINAAAAGPYVFLLSCAALIFGIVRHSRAAEMGHPSIAVCGTPLDSQARQTERLAKLEAARSSGVLTEEEFQRKKAELFSRM